MTDYSPPEDLLIALQESLGDTESFSFALSRGWVPYNASTSPAWGDWLLNNLAPLIFQHHGDKYHLFIANVVVHLCRYIEDENAGTEIGITPRLAIYLQKIMLRMIKRVNALAGDRFSKASDESKLRIQECRDFVSEDTWKWICEIFDIDIGLHEKLDRVRNLVKKQKLAQAASLATDYMVQCYLGEEELLIPLAKKKMFQNIFQFLEGNAFSQVDQQKLGKLQSLAVDLVFKESNSDKFPLK